MSKKSLSSILADVDEREESPDTEIVEQPERVEAVEDEEADAGEPKGEQVEAEPEAGDDKKDGLPPWMHARVKSSAEAKAAAERRAEEAERRAEALEQQMQQAQQYEQPEPTLGDHLAQMQLTADQKIKATQVVMSKRMASAEFGADTVEQALAWAFQRCDADPQFNQKMWSSNEPAFDAVVEYRKAQTIAQLDQYGGDIDKLIEAKLAERGGAQPSATPSPQATRKLPGNFATGTNAGGQRSGPAYSGPKPLGDLLK